MIEFKLNGNKVSSAADVNTPLLWVIRDEFGFKGTKFGCGIGMCGACTVHMDGAPVRTCSFPLIAAENKNITTIEGLENKHPLQQTWIEEQVPQCGYCQSGQIMQAATLLANNPSPSEQEIVDHMSGNLCRCMAYVRIKSAIKNAAEVMSADVETFDASSSTQQS